MLDLIRYFFLKRYTLSTPIDRARYVVIDTELTGLDPRKDSVVSIGAIEMEGSKILLGRTFYRVVAPACVDVSAVPIHGITPQETMECPKIEAVLPEFVSFCEGAVLVGHRIGIDLTFINRELKENYGTALTNPSIDTFRIYKWLKRLEIGADAFYEEPKESETLFDIAGAFGITVNRVHDALYDAYITAQLFQRFLPKLIERGVRELRDLLRIGQSEGR